MAEQSQTYENHVRYDPPFHFFAIPVLAIGVGFAVWRAIQAPVLDSIVNLAVMLAVFVTAFKMRIYSLKVQDRVIRLEERLRLMKVLPPAQQGAIPKLSESQLIGLRFASDAELPGLVDKSLANNWERADIKKAIGTWRADYWRV